MDRLSKFSLDEDNKKVYSERAKQWHNKADEITEKLDKPIVNPLKYGKIKLEINNKCTISKNINNIDFPIEQRNTGKGYRWSGHTYPGVDINVSLPSSGDKAVLQCFKQKRSAIYDSKGNFRIFEKE